MGKNMEIYKYIKLKREAKRDNIQKVKGRKLKRER